MSIWEDLHVGGIVEYIWMADAFSAGPPFDVKFMSGELYSFLM